MALRSQSLSTKYKSLQRSYGSMSSSLSSYSKTIQRRTQSAEDKIIDDNYSNGLISTDAYIRELEDRQTRTYLTPLQRTNLGIKIRDTQEKYTDEMMQTAYQSGGFFNGQKIDDSYMLSYEKEKLAKMDPNSTAYQQQVQKVQSLQTKIETQTRKELRTQRELEIAQTPAYNFETLRAKQSMYEELAADAQADGDVDAYKSYLIQATNYKNAADKAEIGFDVNQDVQKLNEDRFLNNQDIKYGDTPEAGSKVPGAVSAPIPGSEPTQNELPQDAPAQEQQEVSEDILDKLEAMSWGDLSEYYNDDDLKKLETIDKSVSTKRKSLDRMVSDKAYYDQLADRYIDAANASTDPDEQLKYWQKISDSAQKSTDLLNRINEIEGEIENAGVDSEEKIKTLNQSVANRILSEAKTKLLLDKAELDKGLQEGTIDASGFIDGQVGYVSDYMRFLNVKRYIFNDIYTDPKEVDQIDTETAKYNDEITKTEAAFNNKWAYAGVISPEDGLVKLENVQSLKDEVDDKGNPMFDKMYQKVGNAFAKVEYKDKKGVTLTKDELSEKSAKDLEKYRKVATIWRKLDPNGPRVQTVTEFTKDGGINKISVRDSEGNVQPYFERPKEEGLLSKVGTGLLGAAAWLQEKVVEPVVDNVVKPAANYVGNAIVEDRQNRDNFLRSVVGQPAQAITSNLRSMKLPSLMQTAYAAEMQPTLTNVPEEYTNMIVETANKYGIKPEIVAGLLSKESNFDATADNGEDRGIAQINRNAHPEISDEQALDPAFAIDFVGKEISRLKEATGSEFDALRAYNGGLSGYNQPNVAGITNKYASDILERAKTHTQTVPGIKSDIKSDVKGLRSQNQDINYAGTILSGKTLGPNPKPIEVKSSSSEPTKLRSQQTQSNENIVQKATKAASKKVEDVKKTVSTVKAVAPIAKAVAAPVIRSVVNSNPTLKKAADTVSNVKKFVSNPVQTVKEAAKKTWDDTKKKVSNVVSGIRSWFK